RRGAWRPRDLDRARRRRPDHRRRSRCLGGDDQLRDPVRHLEARPAHLHRRAARSRRQRRGGPMSQASLEAPPQGTAPTEEEDRISLKGVADTALAPVRGFFGYFGEHSLLLFESFMWLFRRPFRLKLFLEQMHFVGVGSLPIIMLVGLFSGAVAAQQAINALAIFNQERFVGATVGLSLAQELAPVFTALMITARAGSGMATELGSMRITEQIDALN